MTSSSCFLVSNGIILPPADTPSVSAFLESHPGAYTTTRTHNNASRILFWDRHLQRLANSARILLNSNPTLLFKYSSNGFPELSGLSTWDSAIRSLVDDSMSEVLSVALGSINGREELAITALVEGNSEKLREVKCVDEDNLLRVFNVFVHVGSYVPPGFGIRGGGARLAVVGRGRDVANAKYSRWVRLRKPLEKLRAPSITELLLSNDGDQILEGCVTNFFVVCRKDYDEAEGIYSNDLQKSCPFEVQTAPLSDGILPGVIRQLVIEICLNKGIPLQEAAPSWSKHDSWEEAFITSSLRLVQHVEKVQIPDSWKLLESKTWKEVNWEEKQFEEGPGKITTLIQKELMERAGLEGYPFNTPFS